MKTNKDGNLFIAAMIILGGEPLSEYTDPDDVDDRKGTVPTAIVYVQSEEGKAFSVHLKAHDGVGLYPEADSVKVKLSLDGATWKKGCIVRANQHCIIQKQKYQVLLECQGQALCDGKGWMPMGRHIAGPGDWKEVEGVVRYYVDSGRKGVRVQAVFSYETCEEEESSGTDEDEPLSGEEEHPTTTTTPATPTFERLM